MSWGISLKLATKYHFTYDLFLTMDALYQLSYCGEIPSATLNLFKHGRGMSRSTECSGDKGLGPFCRARRGIRTPDPLGVNEML